MIEQGLFFAAGLCVAILIWILALPAFWRRAMRLSHAQLVLGLPLSLEEILAEQDRLRAAHAVAIAQVEQASARHVFAATKAKQEASACRADYAVVKAELAQFQARVDTLEQERAQMLALIEVQRAGILTLLLMMPFVRNTADEHEHSACSPVLG